MKNSKCSCGNSYVYGNRMGGLFTESKEFDLDVEMLAGAAVGVTASKLLDPQLEKVDFFKENQVLKQAAKAGAGVLLTQFGVKFLDGVGVGMVGDAAANVVYDLLPDNLKGAGNGSGDGAGVSGTYQKNKKMTFENQKQLDSYIDKYVQSKMGAMMPLTDEPGTENSYIFGNPKEDQPGTNLSYLYGNQANIKKMGINVS